jgi:hypothetical protein
MDWTYVQLMYSRKNLIVIERSEVPVWNNRLNAMRDFKFWGTESY